MAPAATESEILERLWKYSINLFIQVLVFRLECPGEIDLYKWVMEHQIDEIAFFLR